MENNKDNDQAASTIWIADFTINEPLHETSSSISAAYTRLAINFPENLLVKVWDEQALIWHRYYTNINKMSFKSHEEGESEIKRIGIINREVLKSEQELLRKNN